MKYSIVYILSLFILLSSCNDDNNLLTGSSGDQKITVELLLPADNPPFPKAMEEADENHMEAIDVFVFNVESGNETFAYKATGISINNISINTKTFMVTLIKSTNQQRIVILANSRNAVNNLGEIPIGSHKDVLLSRLQTERTQPWNSTSSLNFDPIPMWGESSLLTLNNTSNISGIKMLRMLARIDIQLSGPASTNFNLQSAYIYNRNIKGRIVPDITNWDTTSLKVIMPTIPYDAALEKGPLGPYTTINNGFEKDIYIFETNSSGEESHLTATCLIVGGTYQGETIPTYYRIDFFKDETQTTYRNILRNHSYVINITNVLESGHLTPDEAFNSKKINIEAEIVEWNLAEYNLNLNGQYLLTFNQNEFILSSANHPAADTDNKLIVFTNHPAGWAVTKITDIANQPITWLTTNYIPGIHGNPNITSPISLLTTVNDSGSERTGYVYVQAGNLQYAIKVTQEQETIEATGKSNCYILKPGGDVITIPVSRANEDGTIRIGSSDILTAELVWTDNSNKIASNSNIANIGTQGTGNTGYITVTPGNAEGNAVVAVKVDGVIKWSWHIWVTNYTPNDPGSSISYNNGSRTTVFMDRNLGALSNTMPSAGSNDTRIIGMYYQWGRKDAFPGPKLFNGTPDNDPIYDATGTTQTQNMPATTTINTAIENPKTLYFGTDNWLQNRDDNLWDKSGSNKSVYDPCPEGWRIPTSGSGNTSPWYSSSSIPTWELTWNHGFDFNLPYYNIRYYPAGGHRENGANNEDFREVGTEWGGNVNNWSASLLPDQTKAYILYVSTGNVDASRGSNNLSWAINVRCIKE